MVDFINEVEEELRKDKYNVLLRKFGPYIVGVVIVIVAVAAFFEFQKYSSSKQARAASVSYVAAGKLAEDGDLQAAIDKFVSLSELSPDGYAGLSLSRAAGLKVKLGDLAGAVDYFDRSSQAFNLPVHRDLSSLKSAYLLMELGQYDDVRARVSTLTIDGAPFQDLAKELQAYADLKSGNVEAARTQFSYLANVPGVLDGVKGRSKQTVILLNANKPIEVPKISIETVEAPKPASPATKPEDQKDQ